MAGEEYSPADCRRLFGKLAAKGVWQTPTLAFFQTLPDVFSSTPLSHSEYASDSLLELTRKNIEVSHVPPASLQKMRVAGQIGLRAIKDLQLAGSRFLAGCDGLVPGFCLHDELEWFTKAGFSPLEALQTATINPPESSAAKPHRVVLLLGNEPTWCSWMQTRRLTSATCGRSPL